MHKEMTMLKIVATAVVVTFVAVSPLAYAQTPSAGERLGASDAGTLTNARIAIVKTALQLTPDQEKYWPAVEDAIRTRAQDRRARITNAVEEAREARNNPIQALRDRNPIDFLHRRADALAQRAADLKKLADAWQPLYQTLSPEQKQRMGALAILVFREMRNAVEQRRLDAEDTGEN
jgi:hypothetical protein